MASKSQEGGRNKRTGISTLTLPIRYRLIDDCRKMHNLLTLVDQLDFICKTKRKSISVTKKKNVIFKIK